MMITRRFLYSISTLMLLSFSVSAHAQMFTCTDSVTGSQQFTYNPKPSETVTCKAFVSERGGYAKMRKGSGKKGGKGGGKGGIAELWKKSLKKKF